jgi:alkylhydroperoxidase family enzyme
VAGTVAETVVAAVLADWRTAPVNEKVRAVLAFLEKLTTTPADLGPRDIESMRAVGVNDKAIRQAIYVCFLFSVMDRLADAFGFDMHAPEEFKRGGRVLYARGYGRLSIPW